MASAVGAGTFTRTRHRHHNLAWVAQMETAHTIRSVISAVFKVGAISAQYCLRYRIIRDTNWWRSTKHLPFWAPHILGIVKVLPNPLLAANTAWDTSLQVAEREEDQEAMWWRRRTLGGVMLTKPPENPYPYLIIESTIYGERVSQLFGWLGDESLRLFFGGQKLYFAHGGECLCDLNIPSTVDLGQCLTDQAFMLGDTLPVRVIWAVLCSMCICLHPFWDCFIKVQFCTCLSPPVLLS